MPRLSELGLSNDRVGEDLNYETMPDQMGSFQDPPQPGDYRFKLPKDLSAVWDKIEHTKARNPGTRVVAVFDSHNPLVITQSVGNVYNGEPFETRISNAERKRGKKEDTTAPEVSDMDYLLRDSFKIMQKPKSNPQYVQTMMTLAGKEFGASIEWNWFCNDKKLRRVINAEGASVEDGLMGCGARYYQKDIEKIPSDPENPASPKVFPRAITCSCGANVRGFANLTRFRE